jgi:hypothetical protein
MGCDGRICYSCRDFDDCNHIHKDDPQAMVDSMTPCPTVEELQQAARNASEQLSRFPELGGLARRFSEMAQELPVRLSLPSPKHSIDDLSQEVVVNLEAQAAKHVLRMRETFGRDFFLEAYGNPRVEDCGLNGARDAYVLRYTQTYRVVVREALPPFIGEGI